MRNAAHCLRTPRLPSPWPLEPPGHRWPGLLTRGRGRNSTMEVISRKYFLYKNNIRFSQFLRGITTACAKIMLYSTVPVYTVQTYTLVQHKGPILIRVTDMFWTMGSVSNIVRYAVPSSGNCTYSREKAKIALSIFCQVIMMFWPSVVHWSILMIKNKQCCFSIFCN